MSEAPEVSGEYLAKLTAEIATRLRTVCAHMPDDEFQALVLDIARKRIAFEQRPAGEAKPGA